jgi:pilus assembly protein Flp/PilA
MQIENSRFRATAAKDVKGQRGQGLIEYLVLTCLVAISAVAVVSVVGQNIRARYATLSSALRGDRKVQKELNEAESSSYQLRGFDDYTESASSSKSGFGR